MFRIKIRDIWNISPVNPALRTYLKLQL